MNEAKVFNEDDKHANAFDLIRPDKNCVAKQMEERLRAYKNQPDYKITADPNCLACHGDMHNKPDLNHGISCESCHGPAERWESTHYNHAWRVKSAQDKALMGFVDVRNPVVRAKVCFSCHIGDPQHNKIVTHEMYAVGHPPLPSVEIETFVSEMPTHWRHINEKADFVKRDKWIELNLGIEEDQVAADLQKSKAVLVSGVVALRQSVNLFVTGALEREDKWPELAAFDCRACHHDLKSPSWRQERGYVNAVPGRPLPLAWPTALVKLAIRHRAANDTDYDADVKQFEAHLATVYSAAVRTPFGSPSDFKKLQLNFGATVPPQAKPKDLVEWLDKLADDVFKSHLNAKAAEELLDEIVALPRKDYPDFHSARQLIWAFRTIAVELKSGNPGFEAFGAEQTLDELNQNHKIRRQWLKCNDMHRESIDKQLEAVGYFEMLKLDLRVERKVDIEEVPTSLSGAYDQNEFYRLLPQLKKEIIDNLTTRD